MGFYDREYYQESDAPRGYRLGGQSRTMATNLVIVTVVVFVLDTLAGSGLTQRLTLYENFYMRPWQAYQLLTYGFVHAGPWHVGLNMFMLWMFGRIIEQRLGRKEFLLFYLVAIVFSGLVWVLSKNVWLLASDDGRLIWQTMNQLPAGDLRVPHVVGASGGVVAVFLLFVLFYPRQTVYLWGLIAVPAWVIGALLIGNDLIRGLTGAAGVTAVEAHLGGAAFAFLYLQTGLSFSRMLPGLGALRDKIPRGKPQLRLHNPDDDLDELAQEADRILAKVHAQGEQSLTGRERRTLEKYSRLMRQRRG